METEYVPEQTMSTAPPTPEIYNPREQIILSRTYLYARIYLLCSSIKKLLTKLYVTSVLVHYATMRESNDRVKIYGGDEC